jgi:hypothetical protein
MAPHAGGCALSDHEYNHAMQPRASAFVMGVRSTSVESSLEEVVPTHR